MKYDASRTLGGMGVPGSKGAQAFDGGKDPADEGGPRVRAVAASSKRCRLASQTTSRLPRVDPELNVAAVAAELSQVFVASLPGSERCGSKRSGQLQTG
eukprot:781979-Amphidinium_carterae.1